MRYQRPLGAERVRTGVYLHDCEDGYYEVRRRVPNNPDQILWRGQVRAHAQRYLRYAHANILHNGSLS